LRHQGLLERKPSDASRREAETALKDLDVAP